MADATLPVPVTWTGGPIKVPLLRATVADAVAFLGSPPMFLGAQTQTAQVIGNTFEQAVLLDTEYRDNQAGHSLQLETNRYFPQVPGWYLCEASVPLNYTGGTGIFAVQIGGQQNGGGNNQYTGNVLPAPAGGTPSGVAAKLMKASVIGTDWSGIYVYQSSGANQDLQITDSKFPYFQTRWVAALSGTQPLPVPPLASWVAPASYVTSAFLNANIRDTIGFLTYPPVCEYEYIAGSATLASGTSLPATGTTIHLDTKVVDNYSAFSTSTSTWTAPVAGVYYAYFCCTLSATGSGAVSMAAGLTITSSNYNSGSAFTWWGGGMQTQPTSASAAVTRRRLRLNAGDTVKPAGFQNNSGASAATIGGALPNCCTFIMVWESL